MAKILVIEDEHLVRENILERLEFEGYNTISAANGVDGLTMAQEYKPDLIICDVMMPEMDGYGVLEALRKHSSTATIPFIFLTAKADKLDLRQGMELGADDYLTKPFTKNELLGAIASRLDKQAAIIKQSAKKLESLRTSITNALPQELLQPIMEISGFAKMIVDNYDSVKPYEILEMAQNLDSSAARLQRLVENFIMYAQIELLATNPEEVRALSNCQTLNPGDIASAIAIQKAEKNSRKADLLSEVANTAVRISKQDLKKVLEEVIDNAFKFSQPGTPVQLKTFTEQDMFKLHVTNFGRTMTPEQIESIGACMQFDRKFYEQQGLGLGLVIAKRITEIHGGQLTIAGAANSQTTVCIALQR